MNKKRFFPLALLILMFLAACQQQLEDKSHKETKGLDQDIWTKMLVEIPAGTIEKYELNKETNQLVMDSIDGEPRLINYLGYPANYGMIPKTILPKNQGGDGDPLDVISIGPPARRGEIVDCKIIGVLKLSDNGEQDDKLIGINRNSSLIKINSIDELKQEYPGILNIIETWFLNYKGKGKMKSSGFSNKESAALIYKAAKKEYEKLN